MANDLEKLQGAWDVTSLEADGRPMPAETLSGSTIVIKGERFTSVGMGATYEGTVEINEKKGPKTIDLVFTVGHAAGTRNLGIYTIDGDVWTICLATRGTTRPDAFATEPGSGLALERLERAGVPRKKKKAKSPSKPASRPPRSLVDLDDTHSGAATEWEGDWAMVAAVFNGAAMAESMVKWCRRVTRGNVTSVVAGPQLMLKARFTLDRSQTPHAVDYVNVEGPNTGKPQAGIFELKGGTLNICMSAPGRPRPTDFISTSGDGRSHTTWRLATT